MEPSNRFQAGRFHAGRFSGSVAETDQASYSVFISGLSDNPTYGPTAEIGVQLVASAQGFSGAAPATIAWQWRNSQGDIPGATDATYVPGVQDDLDAVYPVAFPSDTYPTMAGAAYAVRFAPPTIQTPLDDLNVLAGSGDVNVATDSGFAGENLTYALAGDLSGLQIVANSGLATVATNGGVQSGSVSVSASNSGGTVTQDFVVTIGDEPFNVDIGGLQNGIATIGSTVTAEVVWFVPEDEIARIRWRRNGKVISGERDPSYVVDPSMAGNVLSCTVTTVNNGAKTSDTFPVS
ncbi:hypothetical protein [Sedimentitalea todarodis]|uniref:Ig-like domain-containing protein n=1 Tax=Sedimentitalea todarodis TaxID=1631240 RepID=A0ABU3VIG7_9RHOB|nr:hypothetical protein [Sedimentitalea todarodis]MDU9005949.1 hypothetical protein [Sedimentitalea todarodis]